MRALTLFGPNFVSPGPFAPPTPPVNNPSPTDPAATYPDDQPAPGAIVEESAPADEGTASGTITIQPSWAIPVTLRTRRSRMQHPDGGTSAYSMQTSGRQVRELRWRALGDADYATLLAQLIAAKSTPVNWTPPGESAKTWKVRGAIVGPKLAGAVHSLSATLEETR